MNAVVGVECSDSGNGEFPALESVGPREGVGLVAPKFLR